MTLSSGGGPGGQRAARRSPIFFVAVIVVLIAMIGASSFYVVMSPGASVAPTQITSGNPSSTSSGGAPGPEPSAAASPIRAFQSAAQLQGYMAENAASAQNYDRYGGAGLVGGPAFFPGEMITTTATMMMTMTGTVATGLAVGPAAASASTATSSSPSYTGTNDQVQGVDEPDIVKTDGTYLYVATGSGTGSWVDILRAYPPSNDSVLSALPIAGEVLGLEISPGRLMVIDEGYSGSTGDIGLLLYNTSIVSSPALIQNVTIPGSYVSARMVQGYLYAIVQQPSYTFDSEGNATGTMPYILVGGQVLQIPPSSVFYTPNDSLIGDYTLLVSMSMDSGSQSTIAVLTGPSSTVFASTTDIYFVYSNYRDFPDTDDIPGDVWTGGVLITAPSVQQDQNSTILRASYLNGTVTAQAAGSVPGSVLNQYSMGEYQGYFMVATSRLTTVAGNATESDDVYVLNQSMSQVSALRDIAPGENLYAVRFSGDMGYVVTFEQVDPLFAISFADISHPVILSALKVNGYSDYLQPLFNGQYLLGVGKETVASSSGAFAYYLGLKLSLFHIAPNGSSSDVQDYIIGDRGTDSPVLTDPLALTYDPANNITVIPVLLAQVPANEQTTGVSQGPPPTGNPVWQGVYVFQVNSTGFTLLGRVTQYPAGTSYGDSTDSALQIDRSVIIGGYLYTISQSEVMVSSLSSLSTVATVPLPGA